MTTPPNDRQLETGIRLIREAFARQASMTRPSKGFNPRHTIDPRYIEIGMVLLMLDKRTRDQQIDKLTESLTRYQDLKSVIMHTMDQAEEPGSRSPGGEPAGSTNFMDEPSVSYIDPYAVQPSPVYDPVHLETKRPDPNAAKTSRVRFVPTPGGTTRPETMFSKPPNIPLDRYPLSPSPRPTMASRESVDGAAFFQKARSQLTYNDFMVLIQTVKGGNETSGK
ncbi:hypothetical protein BJ085DRAFT_29486 [Dimargaris cristalligena]|uniref:Uncharacterized protein n=1 Tax=Dimargaris cristalligena TaxID=215637 RepID=A0A4V1J5A1_9FUNG|nr:hypothetical protein BJ085DRAFT_29486 [Dimargaris cristalligena]|eukprot:RKP38339.1 hypothetical protein BJ085DRAFT_29486 [Dimargaris cristalligena]